MQLDNYDDFFEKRKPNLVYAYLYLLELMLKSSICFFFQKN